MYQYICQWCRNKEDVTTSKAHCSCGGLWNLDFSPPAFEYDLLDETQWNIFRYRRFMPLLDDSWKQVTLGEGLSPLVALNDNLLVKMDYFMPTLSFKDRGAAVLMAHALSIGVKEVIQDSSGNAGNSVAAYSAKASIASDIFVPEGTSDKKMAMIKAHGAHINIIPGSRDQTAHTARKKVVKEGTFYASHVYNPYFYEGTKTYIYEVFEELERMPSHLFIPVGNGTLFLGVMKGLEHLFNSGLIHKIPQIVGVQTETVSPLYNTFYAREKVSSSVKETLAEGIAIGEPMRAEEILAYSKKYDVQIIRAPEDRILEGQDYLAQRGIFVEKTSAVSMAGYWQYIEKYGKLEETLLPMTGAGLKSEGT